MRTGNPTLTVEHFHKEAIARSTEKMTVQGTANKSIFLLSILILTAGLVALPMYMGMAVGSVTTATIIGSVGSLIMVIVASVKKQWSPIIAPIYAVLEGLFIGGASAMFESMYPGIVLQASLITFGTFFGLLTAYKSGLIQATENFKLGVFAATMGIMFTYLISFVMSFFGASIPMIHSSGLIGILFSGFVVVIAALNLVLDFDFIEAGEKMGAPKYMEWYASIGLLVTLVWLYIEILRLLAKLRD